MSQKIKFYLSLFLAIFIIGIIIKKFGFQELNGLLKTADPGTLFFSAILFISTLLILSRRWYAILINYNNQIKYRDVLLNYLGSVPVSKISPSNSGDLIRAAYLKDKINLSTNIGIVIFENILDIFTLSILVLIGSLLTGKKTIALYSFILLIAIIAFIKYISKIKNKKWKTHISNALSVKEKIFSSPKLFTSLLFYSFSSWILVIICVKLFFLAYGNDLPILTVAALQPIAIFLGLLPITFSGIGIRESAMLYLYAPIAEKPAIIAVGLTYSAMAAFLLPIVCLPFLIRTINKKL